MCAWYPRAVHRGSRSVALALVVGWFWGSSTARAQPAPRVFDDTSDYPQLRRIRLAVPGAAGKGSYGAGDVTRGVLGALRPRLEALLTESKVRVAQKRLGLLKPSSASAWARIGRELGVDWILRLRVTRERWLYTARALLIRAEDGAVQMDSRAQYYRPASEALDRGQRVARRTLMAFLDLIDEGSLPSRFTSPATTSINQKVDDLEPEARNIPDPEPREARNTGDPEPQPAPDSRAPEPQPAPDTPPPPAIPEPRSSPPEPPAPRPPSSAEADERTAPPKVERPPAPSDAEAPGAAPARGRRPPPPSAPRLQLAFTAGLGSSRDYEESPSQSGNADIGYAFSADLGARFWTTHAVAIALDSRLAYDRFGLSPPTRELPSAEQSDPRDAQIITQDLRTSVGLAFRI